MSYAVECSLRRTVWPSISCLFQTIETLTGEDRRCDWFRMSHKEYRNFTKMSEKVSKTSAKSLNATNTGCLRQQLSSFRLTVVNFRVLSKLKITSGKCTRSREAIQ